MAARLGYPAPVVDRLPDTAVESFAGVGNPFAVRTLQPGERVVDVGCGAGFGTVIAADQVGSTGRVVGVDMTAEMLAKARRSATELGLEQLEIREGLAEALPVDDGWGGRGDRQRGAQPVRGQGDRVRRDPPHAAPGGALQFADIANGNPVPAAAMRDIDLWTG